MKDLFNKFMETLKQKPFWTVLGTLIVTAGSSLIIDQLIADDAMFDFSFTMDSIATMFENTILAMAEVNVFTYAIIGLTIVLVCFINKKFK